MAPPNPQANNGQMNLQDYAFLACPHDDCLQIDFTQINNVVLMKNVQGVVGKNQIAVTQRFKCNACEREFDLAMVQKALQNEEYLKKAQKGE